MGSHHRNGRISYSQFDRESGLVLGSLRLVFPNLRRHLNSGLDQAMLTARQCTGGGGGTYGVVYALTSKAHTDIPVSGANLTFRREGLSADTYYAAVSAWHANLPKIVDVGGMAVYFVTNESFALTPFTGPGIPASEARQLLKPFTDTLEDLGIKYNMTGPTDFLATCRNTTISFFGWEVGVTQYGGRLIPRSVIEINLDGFSAAVRNISEQTAGPCSIAGVALNVNMTIAGDVDNAVLPAWRDSLISVILNR